MLITKKSGEKEIIETGSAILFDSNSDLSFYIECSEDFSFYFVFSFQKKEGEQDIELSVKDKTIYCLCTNFENPLGTGILSGIELATYKGKKIFANFWVSALGNAGSKRIDYTLYKEV